MADQPVGGERFLPDLRQTLERLVDEHGLRRVFSGLVSLIQHRLAVSPGFDPEGRWAELANLLDKRGFVDTDPVIYRCRGCVSFGAPRCDSRCLNSHAAMAGHVKRGTER